jgi:hypothetical protein
VSYKAYEVIPYSISIISFILGRHFITVLACREGLVKWGENIIIHNSNFANKKKRTGNISRSTEQSWDIASALSLNNSCPVYIGERRERSDELKVEGIGIGCLLVE